MRRRARRGQVVVETAIIMPVFVFLILGLLQLGLMHHARVMGKYAAYKAVRAGSVNRGEKEVMEKAALAVLVPVLGRNSTAGAPNKTDSASAYNTGWNNLKNNDQGGVKFVEVAICNPKRSQVKQNGNFDDPRDSQGQGSGGGGDTGGGDDGTDAEDSSGGLGGIGGAVGGITGGAGPAQSFDWQKFNATKLQVQLTIFYRMYIPFANWMVFRLAVGEETGSPKKMRWLGWKKDPNAPKVETLKSKLVSLADSKKYIMPIRTSYAMRMQSNFSRNAYNALSNGGGRGTSDDCKIPWKRK